MKDVIAKLNKGVSLNHEEMRNVMAAIMSGKTSPEKIGAFLLALRQKGPTVEEITAGAEIMREFVIRVPTHQKAIMDTCGTGGDKLGTFNISSVVSLIIAAAGVAVAKHGNRSVSSRCGSADIFEALGVNLSLSPEELGQCLDKVGLAFLFAQKLHPAMKHVAPVRRQLGVETIFNILGPLTNPAFATRQMMGVYEESLVEPLAYVLKNLGLQRAIVFHGEDGLDEITTTAATVVAEYKDDEVKVYKVHPSDFGLKEAKKKDLLGGDLQTNKEIILNILKGEKSPKRDIVLFNAAFGLYVGGVVTNVEDGLAMAAKILDEGKANQKLVELKEFTAHVE